MIGVIVAAIFNVIFNYYLSTIKSKVSIVTFIICENINIYNIYIVTVSDTTEYLEKKTTKNQFAYFVV